MDFADFALRIWIEIDKSRIFPVFDGPHRGQNIGGIVGDDYAGYYLHPRQGGARDDTKPPI